MGRWLSNGNFISSCAWHSLSLACQYYRRTFPLFQGKEGSHNFIHFILNVFFFSTFLAARPTLVTDFLPDCSGFTTFPTKPIWPIYPTYIPDPPDLPEDPSTWPSHKFLVCLVLTNVLMVHNTYIILKVLGRQIFTHLTMKSTGFLEIVPCSKIVGQNLTERYKFKVLNLDSGGSFRNIHVISSICQFL